MAAKKPKSTPAEPAESKTESPAADAPYKANAKPKLDDEQRTALGARRMKNAVRPAFRRHEWWRYKKLKGKNAPWRVPSGIHSKVRRHFSREVSLESLMKTYDQVLSEVGL